MRGRTMLFAILAAVVLAAVGLLIDRGVFVVRNVVIQGNAPLGDEEIIRAAQLNLGGSIRDVDPERLRSNLESVGTLALDSVEVRYPNTVTLHVRPRTRDAMLLSGGSILILDADGYVIEALSAMPEDGGVYVTGLNMTGYRIGGRISAPEDQLAAMKAALDALRAQGAAALVSELNVSDVRALWIMTRSGIRVELGDDANMEAKARWMRSAVQDLEARGEARGTLDVSSGSKADYLPETTPKPGE